MISSLVIRLATGRTGRPEPPGATVFFHSLALHLLEKPSCAICRPGVIIVRLPQRGTAVLTSDAVYSYSWRTMPMHSRSRSTWKSGAN